MLNTCVLTVVLVIGGKKETEKRSNDPIGYIQEDIDKLVKEKDRLEGLENVFKGKRGLLDGANFNLKNNIMILLSLKS